MAQPPVGHTKTCFGLKGYAHFRVKFGAKSTFQVTYREAISPIKVFNNVKGEENPKSPSIKSQTISKSQNDK
jgi:hypothetical protein